MIATLYLCDFRGEKSSAIFLFNTNSSAMEVTINTCVIQLAISRINNTHSKDAWVFSYVLLFRWELVEQFSTKIEEVDYSICD